MTFLVRSVLLAKGPDSSFGGVPVGYCPDEVHMEEEEVQVKVQAEEEIGETLEPCSVMCNNECMFTA